MTNYCPCAEVIDLHNTVAEALVTNAGQEAADEYVREARQAA